MEKKRIGKTLKIRWAILTGGEPEPLAGRDLTLEISSGNRVRTTLSFVADGNVAEFVFEGSEQRYVGPYTVTMWENLGKEGQTVVDRCDAFCLVARSCEEAESGSSEDPGLEIESLDLGTSNFEAGVPGASAYELFKKYNPDSELTEEEYAEAPVQAAGAALAMVDQLEETEAAMKQAEQIRNQAEQGREASEQARATAEQTRVTAEQQRALAEQARVTNESARQTAEAGRQAAETKREENTAEAIRNSEEATKKAEDEAARVRMLADNPPKIVEVEGAKYWATWDEETEQYVVSENRADVGDAVLFSPQTLTPQQQAQARKNIGTQTEHVFDDICRDERSMYACDGRIYYINDKGHFSSFNERTFEVITYDSISPRLHPYNKNINSSAKRFVVRNDKILFFGSGDTIRQYDLSTQNPIYDIIPISANNSMWHNGLFLEINNRLFVCAATSGYDIVEIDFETGETVKVHSSLKDIGINRYSPFFSYENDDLSLFAMSGRIVKYDKASDEFSVVIDASASGENVDISKRIPTCIFKAAQNDTSLYVFTRRGLCVNELSEVLLGKFDSTRSFVAPGGFRSDVFNNSYPFAQFSANEFISRYVQCSVLNTYDVFTHTLGLSVNADFNRLGYFTKGELGVVFNRGVDNRFRVDALPIYRRYGNDIH